MEPRNKMDNPMIKKTENFKLTYDKAVDAAYIYITDIAANQVADTFTCDDLPESVKSDINLDFDRDGKLLGIEILEASKTLPQSLLSN